MHLLIRSFVSLSIAFLFFTYAYAATVEPANPDSGTGGVAVTGRINCVPENFGVKSEHVIAEAVSNPPSDLTAKISFTDTSRVDRLLWDRGDTGSSVIHVTAQGPVLDSISYTHATTDIECSNAVNATVNVWQSDRQTSADSWGSEGNYSGSFEKTAIWRPALDFDLITHNPSLLVNVKWIVHDKTGAPMPMIKVQNLPQQTLPLSTEQVITGGQAKKIQ